jgi:transcription elongation factor GreA
MSNGSSEQLLTAKGKKEIEEKLDQLVKVERENIKRAISEARALGDLKENAEYHTAKEKQSHIEGKIQELQGVLANAKVVDVSKNRSSKIVFGATVTLLNVEKNEVSTVQIVGDREADSSKGKISYKSPLGAALIGKNAGDNIIVKAPKGDVEYEIEEFEYI